MHNSGASRREIADSCLKLGSRHCEERSDEAIHSFFARQDGLLRGACHRARIRATRWLCHPAVCELICSARKRNRDVGLRQNNPTGKSVKTCPAPREKIFRFRRRANQLFNSARLTQERGVGRRHERCGGMRWPLKSRRRAWRMRTAKSCGSGARSWRQALRR